MHFIFANGITVALFDCTINTGAFTGWTEQGLLPKLSTESVTVMDDATFHKGKSMKQKIEAADHTLEYLPPLFS